MVGVVTIHCWILHVSLALAVATAAGCGKSENKPPATQVVAKVNDEEITVHQINAVLAQRPNPGPGDAATAKREILERLIDQQIAVQQALRRKLDRSPNVLQAIVGGRAETLARAYAEEIARAQPRPSPGEVKKYYAEHPELFGRRRVFSLETISVADAEEFGVELKNRVAQSTSMSAIAGWLRSRNARIAENSGARGAEEIPLQMLARLQAMKDGEIGIFDDGSGRLEVIRVAASTPAPVDEATATPRIQQFLFNRGLNEAMGREMQRLRNATKIEYLGEFAAGAAAATANTKSDAKPQPKDAPVEAKTAAGEPASAGQAKGPPTPSQLQQQYIVRGIRGLR